MVHPPVPKKEGPSGWRARLSALRNVPPLLRMVWATSPPLAIATVTLRLADSVLPVVMLWIGKLIIDGIVAIVSGQGGDPAHIWRLVAIEAGLGVLSDLLGRATVLGDSLLGDRFTNHMSLRMMEHANRLDLISFEDPVFYDKLERARRQTTGRLGMIASIASMCQQFITLGTMSAGLVLFSPGCCRC
jgi:ATP-binding cassette, subfamily B, bacterial